ncbi:MAG: DEAD/DEAH box helicase [Bacteroidales bacterium]|jgi:SNF2 family DNA or RNA helicase|nr:DEAD/DEAH box helicase [Bacteroidales bacterium]
MDTRFAIIIQKHRLIDWILAPYRITRPQGKDFWEVSEFLSPETVEPERTEYEKKIVELVANYDEKQLFNLFATGKKDTQKDFLEKLKDAEAKEKVRNYIEKQIYECYELIKEHNIPLYVRLDGTNLHTEDEVPVEKNDPEVLFDFNNTPTALEYSLQIKIQGKVLPLIGKTGILLSNKPSLLLIENKLYHFSNIDGKKLLPFFAKSTISIPQKFQQQYFDTFVLNCIKNYPVLNRGFEIDDVYRNPKIQATIVREPNGNAALEFTYMYGAWKFSDLNTRKKYTVEYASFNTAPKYVRVHRNSQFEQEFTDSLRAARLHNTAQVWQLPQFHGDGYFDILQWIRENEAVIQQYNIEIFDESDKKIENLQAKINISVESNSIDWFDVYATVTFGDYEIPFKRLRKNILTGNPVVHLPNNQIGIIPEEWFAKYRELFLFSEKDSEGDTFSLKTIHYKTVQQLPVQFNDAMKTRFLHIDTNGIKNNEVPSEIQATLRNYQVEGYRWLCYLDANNFGGCLADDMGLGKTLQTITLLQHVINTQAAAGQKTTSLVVAPTSVVHNWFNEFRKFAPNMKIFQYSGNDRVKNTAYFKKYNVIITTYGLLRNDIDYFEKFPFYYCILDESQMIKNPESKIYNSVLRLQAERRLVLTGTPIENTLIDLWAQLNFVNRDMLGSLSFFKEHFIKAVENKNLAIENQLKKIVNPFVFRREKQEVARDLPPLTEQIRLCPMSPEQEKMYETEKSKVRNMIMDSIEQETYQKSTINVLQALMRLRQIANHPQLVNEEEQGSSGKFDEVVRLLDNLVHNHKVLIFSSFVKHLDLFKEYFTEHKVPFLYLTGSTHNREEIIRKFQEDDTCKIFLISIKAGGVGLNLTKADYIFILDPWWNPAVESQAISRAHRIGQKNNVNVYRFISQNSIEEKIQRLQQKKSELARNYVYDKNSIPFSQEEVAYLVD